jgi:hypothetical protein
MSIRPTQKEQGDAEDEAGLSDGEDPVNQEESAYGVTKVYLSERCSATGVPHLFFDSHLVRRTIWLVILIFCMYRMFVESISFFQGYFTYPVSVSISVTNKRERSKITFAVDSLLFVFFFFFSPNRELFLNTLNTG